LKGLKSLNCLKGLIHWQVLNSPVTLEVFKEVCHFYLSIIPVLPSETGIPTPLSGQPQTALQALSSCY